jgi:peptidoglycan/xylan/chitin deacetylase (PgdA/CDA1 family)
MDSASIIAKKILSFGLFHAGVTRLASNGYRDSIIVSYHHILPQGDSITGFLQPGMYVTTETFEKHIRYLSSRYRIIPLEQLDDLNTQNTCIITFDDGWGDNYLHALPVLERYGVPATIFISTAFIGSKVWPWPDRISYYSANASNAGIKRMAVIISEEVNSIIRIPESIPRFTVAEILIEKLKSLKHEKLLKALNEIDEIMGQLKSELHETRPWMTWDEIASMHQRNITFGAHTHNHVILTNCTIEEARHEITISRDSLSEKINSHIKTFSFPNGNFNNTLINVLKNEGFTHAVTTCSGSINKSESLFSLKRIMLHEDMTGTVSMLAGRLSGNIPFF